MKAIDSCVYWLCDWSQQSHGTWANHSGPVQSAIIRKQVDIPACPPKTGEHASGHICTLTGREVVKRLLPYLGYPM